MTPLVERIIDITNQEWSFFHNQETNTKGKYIKRGKKEQQNGYYQRIGDYWKSINNPNLDGRDDDPWSAAFISFIMKNAGMGNKFLYSEAHRDYINKAISSKLTNQASASFWGYRITEYKPKIGDLVCHTRQDDLDYDSRPHGYSSHCDIVVAIEDNALMVIGGNVKKSVTKKHLKLNNNGFLIDTQQKWFAILQNRV
jgi:hypothetical protein